MSLLQRRAVLNLYKTLVHLGRDWPAGAQTFRVRLHAAFRRHAAETDPRKVDALLRHGQFVAREIEALYMLKKYRTMKRRYYNQT